LFNEIQKFSMKPTANISSIDKAFALLEFLAASGQPASLQEVTDAVKLPKPTAYRLLRTMHELGYVSRPADSRDYLIGPRAARLAVNDPYADLKAHAQPYLRRLHEEFNETVNLGALSGSQVLYLDFLETTQALRFIVSPGQSDPYYCTALGRAAASQLSDTLLNRLMAETRFQALTPNTIKTKQELHRRILKTREDGYAEEIEESVQGVCCLAVSLAPLGFSDAAISMALPAQRLTSRRKSAIVQALKSLTTTYA
jgi:DNA-binding IclR family transcriptional regulator